MELTREQALALLRQYNEEPFHLRHALTVEAVMSWFARELGYGEEAAFWAQAGLLHDLDFERRRSTASRCVRSWRPAGWTRPSSTR